MNATQKQIYYYNIVKPKFYRGYLVSGIDYSDFLYKIRRYHKTKENICKLAIEDNFGNIYTLRYGNYSNVVEAYPDYKRLLEQLKRENPHTIVMEDGSGTQKRYTKTFRLIIRR